VLGAGEEECNESCTKTSDGFVTVKRIFLQLWSDRLLHCRLEEAELCVAEGWEKNIRWSGKSGNGEH
jgi:hypothetical protein